MRYVLAALLLCACGASSTNPDGSAAAADMVMPAGGPDASGLALGQMCTTDGACASGVCAPYKMGTYKLCTERCTIGQAAPQCTAPSDGTCNGMGYCRFPGM